ncbi:DUF5906 domain-containing protein [Desulfonatronovibrio magnus]|uniref:DUF5906 domain-containing protein n=1 Tax=Desulfonatronovibrio magnus TaxID=698827 RepID=UPI0005EB13AB|nr:DUF5906 domain-containing protein [Desulfonatronovibrio magnus]
MSKQSEKISLSVISGEKPKLLTKTFMLDSEKRLNKVSGGQLVKGFVERVEVNNVEELADLVMSLGTDKCLAYGVPKEHDTAILSSSSQSITTRTHQKIHASCKNPQRRKDAKPVIERCRDNFQYPMGAGVFMLDVDCPKGAERLDPEEVLAKLYKVCPALGRAPHVSFSSSSSNIFNSETEEKLIGIKGLRILVVVKNAADIPRAGAVLLKKLWLDGHGHIEISKSGALLVRTLVDGAVWQPERLDFCAGSNCVAPLEQRRPDPVVFNADCDFLDTAAALLDLSPEEEAKYEKLVAEAKGNARPEAEDVRETYIGAKILEEAGEDGLKNPEVVENIRKRVVRALDDSELEAGHVITLSDGKKVTVEELLNKPDTYDGRYCCDPLEPDYNGNSQVAWVSLKEGAPIIYSHAHGGRKFYLVAGKIKKQKNKDLLAEVNDQFAVVLMGSKVWIMKEYKDHEGYKRQAFLKSGDFKTYLANKHVMHKNKMGEWEKKPLANEWLKWEHRRQYDGVVFDPSEKSGSEFFNLYQGMTVKPQKGDWSLLRQHVLDVICCGNEKIFDYLMAWCARIYQDPGGKKPGTCIVLKGGEGIGKSMFVKFFGKAFGAHFLQVTKPNQVTGNFNNHQKDVILLFVDEGIWGGDKAAEGALKAMITEEHQVIEAKGKDAITVANHMNIMIASNNKWVVPAGKDARRFLVLDVSNKRAGNKEYFKAIYEQMENGGLEAMMYDLLNLDISDIDLRQVPRTSALFGQILSSMDPVELYWHEKLNDGVLPEKSGNFLNDEPTCNRWIDRVLKSQLEKDYHAFCNKTNVRYKKSKDQLCKELLTICPGLSTTKMRSGIKRESAFIVPKLDVCRKMFEDMVKMPVDWDEPVEEKPEINEMDQKQNNEPIVLFF